MYPELYEFTFVKGTPEKLIKEWEKQVSERKNLFEIKFSFYENAIVVPLTFENRPTLEQYIEEKMELFKELDIIYNESFIQEVKSYYINYERPELTLLKETADELGVEILTVEKLPYEIEYGVWVHTKSHSDVAVRSLRPSLAEALNELKEKMNPTHAYLDYTIQSVYWHQKTKYGFHHKKYGFSLTKHLTVREFVTENKNILDYV